MSGHGYREQIIALQNQYFDVVSKLPRDVLAPYTDEWGEHQALLNQIHLIFIDPARVQVQPGLFAEELSEPQQIARCNLALADVMQIKQHFILKIMAMVTAEPPANYPEPAKALYHEKMHEHFHNVSVANLNQRSLKTLQAFSSIVGNYQVSLLERIDRRLLVTSIIDNSKIFTQILPLFAEQGVNFNVSNEVQGIINLTEPQLLEKPYAALKQMLDDITVGVEHIKHQVEAMLPGPGFRP